MTEEQLQVIKTTAEELLQVLGIEGSCEVSQADEQMAILAIDAEETGMLIGYHGETLEALQLLISLAAAKKNGEFVRVSVEVGDYKKNREEWLKSLVDQTKQRVLDEGRAIALPNLKPWERRVVHLMLQDDADVVSESMGEGRERTLTISPKNK
jgi:spoIIIJ-associated protein